MTDQQTFGSYRDTKGPVETNKWVAEQRALGNPKILPKADWYKKNEVKIEISNIRKEIKEMRDQFTKFLASVKK